MASVGQKYVCSFDIAMQNANGIEKDQTEQCFVNHVCSLSLCKRPTQICASQPSQLIDHILNSNIVASERIIALRNAPTERARKTAPNAKTLEKVVHCLLNVPVIASNALPPSQSSIAIYVFDYCQKLIETTSTSQTSVEALAP